MYLIWCMESQHPELTLYGSQKECSRTNTVLLLISEVSTGAVSLNEIISIRAVCRIAPAKPGLLKITNSAQPIQKSCQKIRATYWLNRPRGQFSDNAYYLETNKTAFPCALEQNNSQIRTLPSQYTFQLVVVISHLRTRILRRVEGEMEVPVVSRDSTRHRAVCHWPVKAHCYSYILDSISCNWSIYSDSVCKTLLATLGLVITAKDIE